MKKLDYRIRAAFIFIGIAGYISSLFCLSSKPEKIYTQAAELILFLPFKVAAIAFVIVFFYAFILHCCKGDDDDE